MKCEFCNGDTINKKVKKMHSYQGNIYFIENVDAEVCLECGEKYFKASTLDKIDILLKNEHKIKDMMNIEVVTI